MTREGSLKSPSQLFWLRGEKGRDKNKRDKNTAEVGTMQVNRWWGGEQWGVTLSRKMGSA